MIDIRRASSYCYDIAKIENYEKALNSEEIFDVHHRLETHTSDGVKRAVNLTQKELKALDMYFNRPPEELIFLSHSEHTRLHFKGCVRSEEYKKMMREACKGVNKGRKMSAEVRKKMSESHKGLRSKIVDGKRVYYREEINNEKQ